MTPVALGLLAIGLSADAFVVSLGQGAAARQRGFAAALGVGVIFGLIEAATPIIGWAIGLAAAKHVAAFDHWVAFVLLGGVGIRMALHALRRKDEVAIARSGWGVILAAIGTSIDAMVVGVSLAVLNVNIVLVAIAVGLTTTAASTAGMMLGHVLGAKFGRAAEVCAGVALLGLGVAILAEHLGG
nr:manganese efflux pump MntP family protein [Amylibacter sp.]